MGITIITRPTLEGHEITKKNGAFLDGDILKAETLQCVHCGAHWAIEPGSGKKRGFCTSCNGFICGRDACIACLPMERRLEAMESVIGLSEALHKQDKRTQYK